jgi:SAM-dependent methyltransferase
LHPLARQFASVADEYERGRPDYPAEAIASLGAELALAPGATVLDLAAGTGKLTRALVFAGFAVTAVEPLSELREVLATVSGVERVLDGVAEAIPLPDASMQAVMVADAFHWFDRRRALAEIRRVLVPGGGLAIVGRRPDWSGASWAQPLGELVASTRPAHPNFDGPPWQDAVGAGSGWQAPREVEVTVECPTTPERILDHLASMSWIAGMSPPEREGFIRQARELILSGETPSSMPLHVDIGIAHPSA